MNPVHIHLMLTHVPVLLTILSTLIMAIALFSKNDTLKKTAFTGFLFAGLIAIPVFLSGEGAEDVVEKIPGINKTAIEEHEEIAVTSLWLIEVLAAASLLALVFYRMKSQESFIRILSSFTLLFGMITSVSIGFTANKGGSIRHTEISGQTIVPATDENTENDHD